MNKNISFSQYKELYLSPHNQENDITILNQDDRNEYWGFYTSLEQTNTIDVINDSYPNTCNYLLKILPLCVVVFFII